jgi:glycosyltransferase 2 family protein
LKKQIRKYIRIILRLLISSAALVYVLSKADLNSVKDLLIQSNIILVLLALVCFVFSKIVSAYRLNAFFTASGVSISDSINLKLYLLGMFYNLFLPGGIGGDGYKVYWLRRKFSTPVKESLLAILFDRFTGLFALFILCLVFGIFMKQNYIHVYWIVSAIAVGFLMLYLIVYRWFRRFLAVLNSTNLQSFIVQGSQVICAILILLSLGHSNQLLLYLFVFLLSSVAAAIPVSIGGIGIREATFLYAARILQLDLATSLSLSLMFFIITALVSLTGIIYAVRPEKIISLPQTRNAG